MFEKLQIFLLLYGSKKELISLCENDFYRSYDVVYRLPEDVKTTHNEVHKLVFMTCLRMATYKESQVRQNFL